MLDQHPYEFDATFPAASSPSAVGGNISVSPPRAVVSLLFLWLPIPSAPPNSTTLLYLYSYEGSHWLFNYRRPSFTANHPGECLGDLSRASLFVLSERCNSLSFFLFFLFPSFFFLTFCDTFPLPTPSPRVSIFSMARN